MSKAKGKKAAAGDIDRPPVLDEFQSVSGMVETVILLIRAPEEQLNLQALHHIDSFAMKFDGNVQILHEHNLMDAVYPHMQSYHRFVRRFAFKLASQMFACTEAAQELQLNEQLYQDAVKNYIEMNDDFLVEYSAIILNNVCDNSVRLEAIIENPELLQSMMKRLVNTTDPDILLETLKLFIRIMNHPLGHDAICALEDFPFAFLLATTKNAYNDIQNMALDLLANMASCSCRYYDQLFADPLFMLEMFDILENLLWHDLHTRTIALICETLKNADNAKRFLGTSLQKYMTFVSATIHHKLESMKVLNQLATHASCRDHLHEIGFSNYLMEFLEDGHLVPISEGIAQMSHSKEAMNQFLEQNTVAVLFEYLDNEDTEDSIRTAVSWCLETMFKNSSKACTIGIQCGGMNIIARLLCTRNRNDLKAPLIAMLNALSRHRSLREEIMTQSMAKGLYKTLRGSLKNDSLLIDTFKCCEHYVCVETLREELLLMDSYKVIIEGLTSRNELVKQGAVDFVLGCGKYAPLTDMYIDYKVLDCLLQDTEAIQNIPAWSKAIEMILANNLPVKFAYRGHLELSDKTENDFYATKKIWRHFRRVRSIFIQANCSPIRPIIVTNFRRITSTESLNSSSLKSTFDLPRPTCCEGFCFRPADSRLSDYLRIFQEELAIGKVPRHLDKANDIMRFIQILSELVCMKICSKPYKMPNTLKSSKHACSFSAQSLLSFESTDSETADSEELQTIVNRQYMDLKNTLYDCNVIPLGAIEVGSYFEKAYLFKVLCDQTGMLPCSLRMDPIDNYMVWNEVSIPLFDEMQPDCAGLSVSDALKPTHIVDLIVNPGQVYSIGCLRAEKYLAKKTEL